MGRGKSRGHLTSLFGYLINLKKWNSCQTLEPTGCIHYHGLNHRQGYQFVNCIRERDDKRIYMTAHRLAMRIKLGRDIDTNENVVHTCSNVKCVNPDHLILGDARKRSEIMKANGRQNLVRKRLMKRQEKRQYKYTIEQMLYIRNHTCREVRDYLKVTPKRASMIKGAFRKGYRWLENYQPDDKE